MDKVEARRIARSILDPLREESYEDLVNGYLEAHVHREVVGTSGVEYQVEIDAIWDSGEPGNLRVFVAIADGGWSAFKPLLESFIKAPTDRLSASRDHQTDTINRIASWPSS